jgi:plasmid stabilization system protein ParE
MGIRNSESQEAYTLIVNDKYFKYFKDLKGILDYIAIKQKQPLNAIKVSIGINTAMNKIILNPTIYSECENIPTKTKIYREANYKSWLIVFKLKGDVVTILGVLSGKRKTSTFRMRK